MKYLIEYISEEKIRQIESEFETLIDCVKFAENNATNDEYIKIYEILLKHLTSI